jgi:hypothetical protein
MAKKIISLFLMMMATIKKGTLAQKSITISIISLPIAIADYSLTDIFPTAFFGIVWARMIIIDTLLGVIRHYWIDGDFSPKDMFYGLSMKIFLTVFIMILVKTLTGMQEFSSLTLFAVPTINAFLKISVIIYIGGSTISNTYLLSGGKFPPHVFMKRWSKFEKSANVKDLFDKK